VALLLGPALSGCADYMNHRDSVTLAAGNAPEANIAIQTVNPFPPEAWNTKIIADGHPVAKAQAAYNAGKVVPPPSYGGSVNVTNTNINVAPSGN
jgi:hypothetical protein